MNIIRILFLILLANPGWGQQATFLSYSGFAFSDMLRTPEHDLILVGKNFSDDEIELRKVSEGGDEIWNLTILFPLDVNMAHLSPANDHHFLLSGNFIQAPDTTTLIIIKFSTEGEILWMSSPKIPKSVEIDDVFQLGDGTFIMTGTSGSFGNPYYSLFHFDSTASILLNATHHLVENDTLLTDDQNTRASIQNRENGYITVVCNDNASGSSINSDATVMQFDSLGELLWKTKLDLGQSDDARCVKQLKDQSILVAGKSTHVLFTSWARAFVTKLDDSGTILWTNFYDSTGLGAPLFGIDILELTNGDLLLTALKIGMPDYNIVVFLLDSLGQEKNRLWLKRNGQNDFSNVMVQVEDNQMAIAGHQGLPNFSNLLVLFPLSILTNTFNPIIDSPLFEAFPNPVSTELTLYYPQIENLGLQLDIYSETGSKLYTGVPKPGMNMQGYPTGTYYFVLTDYKKSQSYVRKVLKIK